MNSVPIAMPRCRGASSWISRREPSASAAGTTSPSSAGDTLPVSKTLSPPPSPRPQYRDDWPLTTNERHLAKVNRHKAEIRWTNRDQWKNIRKVMLSELEHRVAQLRAELEVSGTIEGLVRDHPILFIRCEQKKIDKLVEKGEIEWANGRVVELDKFIMGRWPGITSEGLQEMWPQNTEESCEFLAYLLPSPIPMTPQTELVTSSGDLDWADSVLLSPLPSPSSSEPCCSPVDRTPKC